MLTPRLIMWIVSVGMMSLSAGAVCGQDYPNKPIRFVTGSAGSNVDAVARMIAPRLSSSLGQQVIVDNRGNALLVAPIVSTATPDGHTLLFIGSNFWVGVLLRDNAPYNPVTDFSPVSAVASAPNILVVHPSVPVRSVKELIDLAKSKPGELNYSAGGTGGASHLSGELFKAMAGVNIIHIPYKSGSQETADLIGGHVQLTFGSAGQVSPHIRSGKLRALAVTSSAPSALFPGLPTVAASGVPGYESVSILVMFVPLKTPATIINRLHQEIVRVLSQADVKEKFFDSGVETVGSSPEKLAAIIRSDMARWGKVIKDAGIKVQ